MNEPYWHLEWRVADPDHAGEYLRRVAVYEDRERLTEAVAGLLARDDIDPACLHVKKYPQHAEMDYGVDLVDVHRAVREIVGASAADLVDAKLREAGRR